MVNIEDKIHDFSTKLTNLESLTQERITNLKSLLASLQSDVSQISTSKSGDEGKITTLENEVKLQEANIESEKYDISGLEAKLAQLNPEFDSKSQQFQEIETSINTLETRKSEISTEMAEKLSRKSTLQVENDEKQQALAALESSIEGDLETSRRSLDSAKSKLAEVTDKNIVWDYMFEILETPEIEIMAVIAANRGISLDEIKQKATSVSPVFVGRAISKLEADGKIINDNEKWDLSPSLLELVS